MTPYQKKMWEAYVAADLAHSQALEKSNAAITAYDTACRECTIKEGHYRTALRENAEPENLAQASEAWGEAELAVHICNEAKKHAQILVEETHSNLSVAGDDWITARNGEIDG